MDGVQRVTFVSMLLLLVAASTSLYAGSNDANCFTGRFNVRAIAASPAPIVKICFEGYTTKPERFLLRYWYKQAGEKGFLKALRKMSRGYVDEAAWDFPIKLQWASHKSGYSNVVCAGLGVRPAPSSIFEYQILGPFPGSKDYPFFFVLISRTQSGSLDGFLAPFARVTYTKAGELSVHTDAFWNLKILGLQVAKP